MEIKTVKELKAAYPDLCVELAKEAVCGERKRIMDIEAVALTGYEEILNRAKYESPISAAEAAMQIVLEQKKQKAAYLDGVLKDAAASGVNDVNSVNGVCGVKGAAPLAGSPDGANVFEEAIDKVLPAVK